MALGEASHWSFDVALGDAVRELEEVVRDDPLAHALQEVGDAAAAGEGVERGVKLEVGQDTRGSTAAACTCSPCT